MTLVTMAWKFLLGSLEIVVETFTVGKRRPVQFCPTPRDIKKEFRVEEQRKEGKC